MTVVGLTGLKRSGKTTAAGALVARGFQVVSFADPVREALAALDPWVGGYAQLSSLLGWAARVRPDSDPWEVLKVSTIYPDVRVLLQRMGTEAGRGVLGPDVWVDAWVARVGEQPVVAPDVRFPNEAEAVHSLGGVVVRVVRPGLVSDGHASEAGIPDGLVDAEVTNCGTVEDLQDKLLAVLEELA